MVGKAVIVILLLSISISVVSLPETERNSIQLQRSEKFPVTTFNYTGNISCYCAPDNSYDAFNQLLNSVEESMYISVYEFQNIHLARSISNLSKDSVDIKLLVDSDPVGGISLQEKYCLNIMNKSGVEVKGTDPDKFDLAYLHSKYIIADNEYVLISSENFGYTGYPIEESNGNRGWGVILEDKNTADYYKTLFNHDWNRSKNMGLSTKSFSYESIMGGYSSEYELQTFHGSVEVKPVICPEHSHSNKSILNMINDAEDQICVQQFYIDDWKNNPYVKAIINASERGCEVKILLDSTWYNVQKDEKDNDDFVEYIENYSKNNYVDIEARLVNVYHGFSKTHNKGMIVDEEKVLISSINWNLHSIESNREVGVIIENKETAEYFKEIFIHDWDNDLIKPIPEAGQDRIVQNGQDVIFNGSKSWDDCKIVTYLWDLNGDGVFEEKGKVITHRFSNKGEYKIKLKVIDKEGHESVDESIIKVEEKNNKSSKLYYILIPIPIIVIISIIYWKKFRD